jgi:hypothetical protein
MVSTTGIVTSTATISDCEMLSKSRRFLSRPSGTVRAVIANKLSPATRRTRQSSGVTNHAAMAGAARYRTRYPIPAIPSTNQQQVLSSRSSRS